MDIAQGGGILSEKVRISTINHPVLVIGLGGTGIDALLRLKYQVGRRFKLPHSATQKKAKPDNIEFLAIETNEHDKKHYKGVTLDPHTEIALLSNAAIGSILNNRSTMPDYIKSWLSPNLTITDGTKGASGNRQAGRLLLFEKINTLIDAIDNKIRTLRPSQENKLLVFVLSGLSGGTGGGMFLDIAYIVRGLMEREYGAKGIDKVETMGYLFTPDVNLSANNLNIHTEEYIQRNGYAALKELDYWMNLEERKGQRFSQAYGTRLTVNSGLAPFNLCHLISASNTDGVYIKGAYDHCMSVTAENIVNFLALEEKETQEFAIQDYYSNLLSNIQTMKTNLPQGFAHSANFTYNIIGASSASLPTEGFNAYMAHSFFTCLAPMFDAMPDDYDLNQFVNTCGLDISALGAELARTLPPIKLDYIGTDFFSHQNVIKSARVNIDEKLTEQYNAAKRQLSQYRQLAAKTAEVVKKELGLVFLNTAENQGPIYAARLLHSAINPCLTARFKTCQEHLQEKITAALDEIQALEILADTRLADAQKAIFLLKEPRKNAYIEAKIKLYQALLQKDCFSTLVNVYKEITALLTTEVDKHHLYVEILQEVRKTFAKNTKYLDNLAEQHSWNMCEVSDIQAEIDRYVQENHLEATQNFAKTLLLNTGNQDITSTISDFLYDQFGGLLSRPMTEFLQQKHGENILVESIVEADIAPRLYKDAKPVFNLDNPGLFNFASYGMVSVPKNAPEILRGIEAYQNQALANSTARFNIRKSNITDRIFWLNTQNGVPLFAYSPIKVYEELYERTIHTREGVGRHLVMNENESWVDLPSPIPEFLWGDTYDNPRQKALNDEAREIFEAAKQKGAIQVLGGYYTCIAKDGKKHLIHTTGEESEALAHFIRNRHLINLMKISS